MISCRDPGKGHEALTQKLRCGSPKGNAANSAPRRNDGRWRAGGQQFGRKMALDRGRGRRPRVERRRRPKRRPRLLRSSRDDARILWRKEIAMTMIDDRGGGVQRRAGRRRTMQMRRPPLAQKTGGAIALARGPRDHSFRRALFASAHARGRGRPIARVVLLFARLSCWWTAYRHHRRRQGRATGPRSDWGWADLRTMGHRRTSSPA